MPRFDPQAVYAPRTYYLKLRWDWIKVQFFLIALAYVLILITWNYKVVEGESANGVLAVALTVVEIALAVLAIVLAIGAFFGFWMIRESAEKAAKTEAVACIEKSLPSMITNEMVAKVILSDPTLIARIAEEMGSLDLSAAEDNTDKISEAFDGDMGDENI